MTHRSKEEKISLQSLWIFGTLAVIVALVWALRVPLQTHVVPSFPPSPAGEIGPKGVTLEQIKMMGEPRIGSRAAPLTIVYWCDYRSLFCRQSEESVLPQIVSNYVETGKVSLVFKDFPFVGADSEALAVLGRAVYAAAPDKFYGWHKAVFDAEGAGGSSLSAGGIDALTAKVLGASVAAKVLNLVKANQSAYADQIAADKTEGIRLGTGAIPAMVVGSQLLIGTKSYEVVKSSIDAALGS